VSHAGSPASVANDVIMTINDDVITIAGLVAGSTGRRYGD